MTTKYDFGTLLRLKATFLNVAGVPTDPTTVTLKVVKPDQSVSSYTYGQGTDIVRESAGVFYLDWDCNTPGIHRYRFYGTGAVQASALVEFQVLPEF